MENGRLKSMFIGTVDRYPNQADAERAVEHLRIRINAENPQQQLHQVTVGALIDRFMEEYTPKRCRKPTQKLYHSLFENHIRRKWGTEFVQNVKPPPWKIGWTDIRTPAKSNPTFGTSCTRSTKPRFV